MSDMLFLPKREIIEMLKEAFNEGWEGYRDLCDSAIERILDEHVEKHEKKRLQETETLAAKVDCSITTSTPSEQTNYFRSWNSSPYYNAITTRESDQASSERYTRFIEREGLPSFIPPPAIQTQLSFDTTNEQ